MSFGSEKTSKWFFTFFFSHWEESLIDKCHDKRLRIKNKYELVCRWVIWNSWSKQSRNMFLYCSYNNKLCDYYTCHRKIHATNSNQTMLQVGATQNTLFRIYPIHIKCHIIFCHLMKFSPPFPVCGEWWIDIVLYDMYVLSIFMPLSIYGSMI